MVRTLLILLTIALLLPLQARAGEDGKRDAEQRRLTYYYLAAEQQKAMGNNSAMADLLQHCLEIDANHPAVNYDLAMIQFNLRNDSLGLKMLKNAAAHDPDNPYFLETLASVYISMHKTEDAVPVLEHMSKLQTKRTDILAQLFQLYKNDGRTQDAINVLDRIQTLQGNNTRIATQKYALYMDLADTVQAFSQMRALCEEHPYDASSLLILGDLYLNANRPDSTRAILARVERIDPHNTNLQMARMQYHISTGDTLRYQSLRDSLILEEKADIGLRVNGLSMLVRECLSDSTQRMHAERIFAELLAPDKPDISFLQLYIAYRSYAYHEQTEQLLPIMERILEVEPSDLQTIETILRYYITKNDIERVGTLCEKALLYHPSEMSFHYFLALSLAQQKRMPETVNALQTAIRQADEQSRPDVLGDVYALLGDVYHEMGNEKGAFEAYDSCLVYAPDNVGCLNNYAYYLSLKDEQLDRAEKMSYRAIKAEPTNKTYLDTYAWILFMQQDYTTARIYMDRVVDPNLPDSTLLESEETNAVLLEHAGDIYSQCGQMEQALRFWKLARQKDTDTKNAILNKKIRKQKFFRK